MSLQSQTKNMKQLGKLLSKDLGYIFGERESGPNGAKKQFLSIGRAFLSALGKDLGFIEQNVHVNKAGIAVSGEITLRGMWNGYGLKFELSQNLLWLNSQDEYYGDCLIIWPTRDAKNNTGGIRDAVTLEEFKQGNYGKLIADIMHKYIKENGYERQAA